jgi:hypothetical protein
MSLMKKSCVGTCTHTHTHTHTHTSLGDTHEQNPARVDGVESEKICEKNNKKDKHDHVARGDKKHTHRHTHTQPHAHTHTPCTY